MAVVNAAMVWVLHESESWRAGPQGQHASAGGGFRVLRATAAACERCQATAGRRRHASVPCPAQLSGLRGARARAWLLREPPDLQQRVDGLLVRRVQHDGDAPDDAQHAAQHAEDVQPLVQQPVREHGTARPARERAAQHGGAACRARGRAAAGARLTMMLSAPSGVTRMAGAKAYAAKLAISPTTMVSIPAHHSGSVRYE